jgi:hypothetical protein
MFDIYLMTQSGRERIVGPLCSTGAVAYARAAIYAANHRGNEFRVGPAR